MKKAAGRRQQAEASRPPQAAPLAARSQSANRKSGIYSWLMAVLLGLVTLALYWPTTGFGFLNYDDADFVTANVHVQGGLNWEGVKWAFGLNEGDYWHPLTWLSLMLDASLFGQNAGGFHFTNVAFHAVNGLLLFLLLRMLTGAMWRSVVVAALFALHPLRVESVAWVTERKDVLSGCFGLLALICYARYARGRGRRKSETRNPKPEGNPKPETRNPKSEARGGWSVVRGPWSVSSLPCPIFYLLSLCFFACGLMSKPMLVTLPFVLLLLDYWPLGRLAAPEPGYPGPGRWLAMAWEKAPFFALAAVDALVTLGIQAGAGAVGTAEHFPLAARAQNAVVSYARYMGKLLWPADLCALYPHPAGWPAAGVALSGGLLLAFSVFAVAWGRRRRYLFTGWFWFVGTLLPVIGLVQVGNQSLADRYTYIPSLGLLLVLVWGARELAAQWRGWAVVSTVLATAAAVLCVAMTRRQIGYWQDDETVWTRAVAVTGRNDKAGYNLGVACFNRGVTLAEQGAFAEAIPCYERAIQLSPDKDDAHSSLAYALLKTGRLAQAAAEYATVLRLNPGDAESHNNLGYILARQGRPDDAIPHLTEALRLNPDYPEAHDNLGAVLASRGRYAEAAAQFRESLRLKPDNPGARQRLERALAADPSSEPPTTPPGP